MFSGGGKTPVQIALVPLISNVSQMIVSFNIDRLYKKFGRFFSIILGKS
jgi:hypothetical protein